MKIFLLFTAAAAALANGDPPQQVLLRRRETSNDPPSFSHVEHRRDKQEAVHANKGPVSLSQIVENEEDLDDTLKYEEVFASGLRLLQAMPPVVQEDTLSDSTPTISKQPPWPHERSDIPPDPNVLFGELDNGVRYMALSNAQPPGRLEIRLHVDVGTNVEEKGEYGLAHYLEHMAFRSLQHFPNGTLLPALQRLGINIFRGHLNAYTSFQETMYYVAIPNLDNETLIPGFSWMHDIVDGALLQEDELEIERGVVLSEVQARDSVDWRIQQERFAWMLPDHLISRRVGAGGREDSVLGLTRLQFLKFYGEYYVPRRITVTAVGDMNASEIEGWIQIYLGNIADTGNRGQEQPYGTLPSGQGFQTNVFVDSEIREEEITLSTVQPYDSRPDTEARRTHRFALQIANNMVSARIRRLSEEEDTPIVWGSAGVTRWYMALEMDWIQVQPKEGRWTEAVATLEQEFRRVILHGFTQAEFDQERATALNAYVQRLLRQDTRESGELAWRISGSINNDYVFSTLEEDLRIAMLALESITLDVVHEVFNNRWNTTDLFLYLITTSLPDTQSREAAAAQLEDLYFASQLEEVSRPVEAETVPFAYTDFGPAGTIISDTVVSDFTPEGTEIRQLVLSNNIRVNLMRTDFEDEVIRVRARFGLGKLVQPDNATYLDDFTEYIMELGGLGEHSQLELDRILAGRNAYVNMGVNRGSFRLSGSTNQEDLELQLQLMTAYLTDPGFGEEAVRWYHGEVPTFMNRVLYTVDGAYNTQVNSWLVGDDSRFAAPTEEMLLAFDAADAKNWITPHLTDSYLELTLVGDLNEQETIRLLLETFGALPERADSLPPVNQEDRALDIPVAPQTRVFTYETSVPIAAAVVVWQIPSYVGEDISERRNFQILASIFTFRMWTRIREQMGFAYSPRARIRQSSAFDYGFFVCYVEGTTEEMDILIDAIVSIAEEMIGAEAISEDELMRAILPIETDIVEDVRENGYWLSALDEAQDKPFTLDWIRNRVEFYESVTVEEINALASQYLTLDNTLRITILPMNRTDTTSS